MSKTALARLARDQNSDTPLHDWQQQQSKQLSLFVGGERQPEQFSNTLEKYDALPKYVMNRRAWCKNEGDIVHHVRRDFKLDGRMHSIELLPAIIRDAKGNQREAFAGTREEMVEQALRKIALRNSLVSLSGNGMSGVGVLFSLYQLQKELQARGHTYSYGQISESITILNRSIMTICNERGEELFTSPYFPAKAIQPRALKGRQRSRDATYVMFHPLVTKGINEGKYRQYDYHLDMGLRSFLSRWLLKVLSRRYRQAGPFNSYTVLYSTLMRDSGIGPFSRPRDGFAAVDLAIVELQKAGVIASNVSKQKIFDPGRKNRVLDIKASWYPTADFIKAVKRANAIERCIISEVNTLNPGASSVSRQSAGPERIKMVMQRQ